ncbi:MAG: hypothetical protein WDN72_04185 [Alphaproteobacteria bacterium]
MTDKKLQDEVHRKAVMGAEAGGILGVPIGLGLSLYGPDELGAVIGGGSMAIVDGTGAAIATYKTTGSWKAAAVAGAGGVAFGATTGAAEGWALSTLTVTTATVAVVACYGAGIETLATYGVHYARAGYHAAGEAVHHGLDNIAELHAMMARRRDGRE